MFCWNCNLLQSDDAIFCEDCGVQIQQQVLIPVQQQERKDEWKQTDLFYPQQLFNIEKPKESSVTGNLLPYLVAVIIFVLVVIFGITILYIYNYYNF